MAAVQLAARKREVVGRSSAHAALREGYIPAVVYGRGVEPQSVEVEEREFSRVLRHDGQQATIALTVAGQSPIVCKVQEIQRRPVTREVRHIDFKIVPEGSDG